MSRLFFFLLALSLFFSCQDTEESSENTTGTLMEIEPSQAELDEAALQTQPVIIQDFFAINTSLIGDNFCYDPAAVRQLILHENDSSSSWSKYEASDHYLTIYEEECEVILEFMTFYQGNDKYAFLSQMNTNVQEFYCLTWKEEQARWVKTEAYPKPALEDYFSGLSPEQVQLVKDYGSDFVYINPEQKSARFIFSEWAMHMNLGEKEMIEFNKETSSEYDLTTAGNTFALNQISTTTSLENTPAYFVAYHVEDKPSTAFKSQYASLILGISNPNLSHQMILYGSNDFDVIFSSDTFNFRYMEQFEPRDGFWFYTPGKEPLDLGADENIIRLIDQAKAYYIVE